MDFMLEPDGIFIHHSATRDTESLSFDAIRDYHIKENGWDEIGYHWVLEDFHGVPMVLTGRGVQYEGAHAAGHNKTLGVCVVGDYDVQPPKSALVEQLCVLLRSMLVLYSHLTLDDIHYHSSVSAKTCPGLMFPPLAEIKDRVANG